MHIFACFIHVRQSVSCLNDWRILGHVFEISLGRPTRGIIQPVQELLFAPITDQRADKMSRIIMPKFNKVKKSCFPTVSVFKNRSFRTASFGVKISLRYIKLIFDKLLQNLFIPTNSSPREIVCDNLKRNSGAMKKNNLSESLHWTT